MNIVVINGSPSGCRGVTAQSVKYLETQFGEHHFETIEVGRRIRKIERERAEFESIVQQLAAADAILWAFPVYVMLVPAQLKRFIELLFERAEPSVFAGKVASAISTSAHHYDHTAHDYLLGVSCDLGMSFVRGFSAGSGDVLTESGRSNLVGFARDFFLRASGEPQVEPPPPRIEWTVPEYEPVLPATKPKQGEGRIVLINDADPGDHNLLRMIEVFERSVSLPVDRLDLRDLRMDGGCLGCMRCSDGDPCGYKDEYEAAFEGRVKPADVVVWAATVHDRFLSARLKVFIDRYFSNGHRPVLAGKAVGFLVSGPLQQLATLREVIEAHIEVSGCHRIGVVTDEQVNGSDTTRHLLAMAQTVERWVEQPWYTPPTFRSVGAYKNFRDLVYEHRGVMSADHRFYKAHGMYDFPNRNFAGWLFQTVMLLCKRIPLLRKKLDRAALGGRMRPYKQLLGTG